MFKQDIEKVVNDFSDKIQPLWKLNKDNYAVLLEYYDVIKEAASLNEVGNIKTSINPKTMEIEILLEDIVYFSSTNEEKMFLVLANTSRFRVFKNKKPDMFNIALSFPSLWETVI